MNPDFHNYIASHRHYFWEWEEGFEVVTLRNGTTIAYREYVAELLEYLSLWGLPPFGTLMLALAATNRNGKENISRANVLLLESLNKGEHHILNKALQFLTLLSELPDAYKTGNNRKIVFQKIFENCHGRYSIKKSTSFSRIFTRGIPNPENLTSYDLPSLSEIERDIRPFEILAKKYFSANDIINSLGELPIPEEELQLEEKEKEKGKDDFIEELIRDSRTFQVGKLIRQIWSGLNIPNFEVAPSVQPLGGISDLSNKGDYDKLLISELAYDDLTLMSRLANNEALFLHREIPPSRNDHERILLLDLSLKNWGIPKIISFALALALARHPKSKYQYRYVLVGNGYQEIQLNNIHDIIAALQKVEPCLHPATGMEVYFNENTGDSKKEIFFVTENSVLEYPEMMKLWSSIAGRIQYVFKTSHDGDVRIFKNTKLQKKEVQSFQLPLEKLWKKESTQKRVRKTNSNSIRLNTSSYPILFRSSGKVKRIMKSENGNVYYISNNKALFRFYENKGDVYNKGWDLLFENLPVNAAEFGIGCFSETNEDYLLIYNHLKKEFSLLNLESGEYITKEYLEWSYKGFLGFVCQNSRFWFSNNRGLFSVGVDLYIRKESIFFREEFTKAKTEETKLRSKYPMLFNLMTNIKDVYINEHNQLELNGHALTLNQSNHFQYLNHSSPKKITAVYGAGDGRFEFPDGSQVYVQKNGILELKSSSHEIPTIYVPLAIDDKILGVATHKFFAGSTYYCKGEGFSVVLKSCKKRLASIKIIKDQTNLTLFELQDLCSKDTALLGSTFTYDEAQKLLTDLQSIGETVSMNNGSSNQKVISTTEFHQNFIAPFIQQIVRQCK